jgi:DNA topoisomerase-1
MGDLAIHTDPKESAKEAGLRYVSDARPGLTRKRSGKGFRYLDAEGKPVRDAATLKRIRSLVIPPAWTEVWICPLANGHLQATGRDARGRKQSRYHPRWREVRDADKYERMLIFGAALPRIRERVDEHLAQPGLPRAKVLATIVRLMETTSIRVGNEEYARENHSYGLTTMRNRHVHVKGSTITFDFEGKSGKRHTIDHQDRRLARIIAHCQDLPGQELFQYLDAEGNTHAIDSSDVNDYLREISGEDFTAKDFRTWAGTVTTCRLLRELEPFSSATQAKKNVVSVIKSVAAQLGNTPSVCRKCYVHPAVLETYVAGVIAPEAARNGHDPCATREEEEKALLKLLEQQLKSAKT